MDYPGLRLDIDRVHAAELGLSQKEIVDNVITALNSNAMIAPNYWVDRKSGNNYFLTVQYYENGSAAIHNPIDLKNIPIRAPGLKPADHARLRSSVWLNIQTPTEIDHYQIQRSTDVYVTTARRRSRTNHEPDRETAAPHRAGPRTCASTSRHG